MDQNIKRNYENYECSNIEVSAQTACEMHKFGMALLIDIRQKFELQMKGSIEGAIHIPFFNAKKALGVPLSEDEQEIIDEDQPSYLDARGFIKRMNDANGLTRMAVLVVCNSGKRSCAAAIMLRELGYMNTYSVSGGISAFM